MAEFRIKVKMTFCCDKCGNELKDKINGNGDLVTLVACSNCLEREYNKGYQKALDDIKQKEVI